jgi:undecaprenyl-phosphate 4-deoxy-4-formamido-L-arabinose transferase
VVSLFFFVLLAVRRLLVGPESEGVFTLFSILFFVLGMALLGIGLLGEYVGRIYQQVRERPRYMLQAVLESEDNEGGAEMPPTAPRGSPAARSRVET